MSLNYWDDHKFCQRCEEPRPWGSIHWSTAHKICTCCAFEAGRNPAEIDFLYTVEGWSKGAT